MAKYINPYTDFGFKRIFMNPRHKGLLMNFLNAVLAFLNEPLLVEMEYQNTEQQPETVDGRKVSFDVYVKDETGRQYLIEMQQADQRNFFKRLAYYLFRMVLNQGRKDRTNPETGKAEPYDYNWNPVFGIALLDFTLDMENWPQALAIHPFRMGHLLAPECTFHDLTLLCLEMPKFGKSLDEAQTRLEEWMFYLKNMTTLSIEPSAVEDPQFRELLEVAAIINLSKQEYEQYMLTLKQFDDYHNTMSYAVEKAVAKGLKQGVEQGVEQGLKQGVEQGVEQGLKKGEEKGVRKMIVAALRKNKLSLEDIADMAEITVGEVQAIKKAEGL